MSATSGIAVSAELSAAFGEAVNSRSVRFLKISIHNESLVLDESVPPSGTLAQDLDKLSDLLESNVPAYVLARLDDPPTEWMTIFYVPEEAKIRDKMLYASTRNNLTKALGSAPFTDSIYATTKADVSAKSYAAHRASLAAAKPMTAREKEMEEIKAAESKSAAYDGSRARKSHLGGRVGFQWTPEAEQAVKDLGTSDDAQVVTISVDPATESLVLLSQDSYIIESGVNGALPKSDPVYAFCAWPRENSKRHIAFIYSCPSSSPIKHRMLYSSGMLVVYHQAKALLQPSSATLLQRKIETADPEDLNGAFMRRYLESEGVLAAQAQPDPLRPQAGFARPKGPARKR